MCLCERGKKERRFASVPPSSGLLPKCLQCLGWARPQLGTQSELPTWVTGTSYLSHHCCFSVSALAGSKSLKLDLGMEPVALIGNTGVQTSILQLHEVCTLDRILSMGELYCI